MKMKKAIYTKFEQQMYLIWNETQDGMGEGSSPSPPYPFSRE